MGIGSGNIGLVNMPTIPSCTFFAKLERCDIFECLRIIKIPTCIATSWDDFEHE